MELEACVSVQGRYDPGRKEEGPPPAPVDLLARNSGGRKGGGDSTLLWFAFRPIAVCVCVCVCACAHSGGRARVINTGENFATHAYQLSAGQTFSPAAPSPGLLTACATCVRHS